MPLNSASSKGESQELTVFGFYDTAFGRVDDKLQSVLQELADTEKYSFTRALTLH